MPCFLLLWAKGILLVLQYLFSIPFYYYSILFRLLKSAIKQARVLWILLIVFAALTVIFLISVPMLKDDYILLMRIWYAHSCQCPQLCEKI